ncbi:MAG: hypothetical protein IPK22_22505 [Verrucomicrobiaceae bacterium]|nr:hypothetical protein [Verrucomicrobiaceae bacterium]
MFDPTKPANNSPNSSAEMRAQLNGLKALIDAIASVSTAVVDGVTTLPPGDPATVTLNVVANTLHFTFGIPQGPTGADGLQGQPGEVSQTDLNNAVATMLGESSANSNGVDNLSMNADPAYDQNQMQAVMVKLDELINALRR